MSGRIICNLWHLLEELEIEFLTLDIHYSKTIISILACFTDPVKPHKMFVSIAENLELQTPQSELTLVQDLNLKDIDWQNRLILNNWND